MDLYVVHAEQIIPSRSPTNCRLLPHHGVCKEQRRVTVSVHFLRLRVVRKVALLTLELDLIQIHRESFNFESNDAILISESE